ncbi:MAG: PIG-L family deacetylase [Anaerolineae bacterium]|nr:PIG-L family deacetylase [Anaerolineae bacterium]
MNTNKRLLVVLAHPDDETFGMGGTLAVCASQGVEVYLICATRGEVGTVDPKFMEGFDSIGQLREQELRCAGETLGLKEIFFLDYRDSGMNGSADNKHPNALAAQPLEEVAAKVVKIMRAIKPHSVVTFDPDGGYRHPDHIAMHKAAVRAFEGAASAEEFQDGLAPHQAERLFYMVFPRKALRIGVRFMRFAGQDPTKFGRNQDIDLEELTSNQDFPLHVRINVKPVMETLKIANQCHASQLQFTEQTSGIMAAFRKLLFTSSTEHFTQVYPRIPDNQRINSLFG